MFVFSLDPDIKSVVFPHVFQELVVWRGGKPVTLAAHSLKNDLSFLKIYSQNIAQWMPPSKLLVFGHV
jgi:hypothetical protein